MDLDILMLLIKYKQININYKQRLISVQDVKGTIALIFSVIVPFLATSLVSYTEIDPGVRKLPVVGNSLSIYFSKRFNTIVDELIAIKYQ